MASIRPSTRANPKGPPVTPISDPEEILRRDRASLRQTSKATPGISRYIYAVRANIPLFQSPSAETYKSQEFLIDEKLLWLRNIQAPLLV